MPFTEQIQAILDHEIGISSYFYITRKANPETKRKGVLQGCGVLSLLWRRDDRLGFSQRRHTSEARGGGGGGGGSE